MKVLLTGAYQYTKEEIETIESLGCETDFLQYENTIVSCPEQYDAVICNALFLYNDISHFTKLKYVQVTSAGLERLPLNYIKEKKIKLYNARGVYSIPMAEHVVLKILEFYKESRKFYEQQKSHEWKKERNLLELSKKNVAILGCGSIGIEIAKRLKAFEAHLIAIDIRKIESQYIDESILITDMDNVLTKADVVIITLPFSQDTYHLFDNETLGKMKKNAILINVSRGKIIDQKALITALITRKIAGAALDVFEEEPLEKSNPLWEMENVIITPHNSYVGDKNNMRLFELITTNMKLWLQEIQENK